MKAFLSIVKLTLRNVFRSHVFRLLFVLLVLCVVFVPASIEGDGTARGFIQVSLKFSLFSVALMLALSAVWSSSMAMTQDVEGYQLHMVITKPVSRVTIWAAKAVGIFSVHALLLVVASVLVYTAVITRYNAQVTPPEELDRINARVAELATEVEQMPNTKERDQRQHRLNELREEQRQIRMALEEDRRIRNEVLVARRRFVPVGTVWDDTLQKTVEMPISSKRYVNARARSKFRALLEDNQKQGIVWDTGTQQARLAEMNVAVTVEESQIKFGERKSWKIAGLPKLTDRPLYLRFRTFVTQVSDHTERYTFGQWYYSRVTTREDGVTMADPNNWVPLTSTPQQYRTNQFATIELPTGLVDSEGTVYVSFVNHDPDGEDMFFQIFDGPHIYVPFGNFTANYFKNVLVIMIALAILCGLSSAAGGVLSMPTAIFVVVTYIMFGVFADIVIHYEFISGLGDVIAQKVGNVVLLGVVPLQNFDVSTKVADGIMVEWAFVGKLFLQDLIFRGMPLFLLGIFLYWRREMGLVIRK